MSGMASPTKARSQGRSRTLIRISGLPQAATVPILTKGRSQDKTAPPAFKGCWGSPRWPSDPI
jgi:hypothetical protein